MSSRQAAYRARLRQAGVRRISVELKPEAAAVLARLEATGVSAQAAINALLIGNRA